VKTRAKTLTISNQKTNFNQYKEKTLRENKLMIIREQLAREIEQTPDDLIEEILDFCLFVKQRKAKEQPNELVT
jgi:hypothetical protein